MLAARQTETVPSAEVRWLRLTVRAPRDGDRRYLGGRFYFYAEGDWHLEPKLHALAPDVLRDAVGVTSSAQKKFDAAPSWGDFIAKWGEAGAVRDRHGKVIGYKYPASPDPVRQRQINEEVLELWTPHMRVSGEIGAEASAKAPPVTLVDRGTGQEFTAHPAVAESKARKRGLVEKRRRVKAVKKSNRSR